MTHDPDLPIDQQHIDDEVMSQDQVDELLAECDEEDKHE